MYNYYKYDYNEKSLIIYFILFLENLQHKVSSEGLTSKKKKPSRKNKTPSKILNLTELRQQPKLP